jgi:hypothetical protein
MRQAALLAVMVAGGCYQPEINAGAPCGPGGECPSGLECQTNRCLPPGSFTDAALTIDDSLVGDPMSMADAPAGLGAWASPIALDLSIGDESDPSMTQDRLTLVLMSEDDDDLYIATRETPTGVLTATKLDVLNSSDVDKSPEISANGSTLYFTSNRDGDYDVYRSTFTTEWSPPVRVEGLSTDGDDSDVAVSPDGLTAVVIDNRATNRFMIHTRADVTQAFGPGVHHPELSLASDAEAPTITNGGAVIYFHAGLMRDVFVAIRTPDRTYSTPLPVSELNTLLRDAAPFVLQDNRHLLFERSNNIYETWR